MHWEKSSPSTLSRAKPYQGVRVRDPVKELLRRKRGLELPSTKAAPPTVEQLTQNNRSPYTPAVYGSEAAAGSLAEPSPVAGDGAVQSAGWRAAAFGPSAGLQPVGSAPWPAPDYTQQERPAQALAYSSSAGHAADVYMQTLCPSYTMLTYTHTPLLTNFGTIPVAPAPTSLPQMELPDSGLTYLPWAQPITTISAMPNTGHMQFSPSPAALPGSPLVHVPLSVPLTTMIPQLEAQGAADAQPQILDLQQRNNPQLDPEPANQSLDEEPVVEPESPSLLDKLLEEQKDDGGEGDKDSYSSSLYIPNV